MSGSNHGGLGSYVLALFVGMPLVALALVAGIVLAVRLRRAERSRSERRLAAAVAAVFSLLGLGYSALAFSSHLTFAPEPTRIGFAAVVGSAAVVTGLALAVSSGRRALAVAGATCFVLAAGGVAVHGAQVRAARERAADADQREEERVQREEADACDARFGGVAGYQLCVSHTGSCDFFTTDPTGCVALCERRGGTCHEDIAVEGDDPCADGAWQPCGSGGAGGGERPSRCHCGLRSSRRSRF